MKLTIDKEFQALLEPLTETEYNTLEANIIKDGCRDALVVTGSVIVDGHNRYEICTKHGIAFTTASVFFESKNDCKIWMIRNQFGKRNWSTYTASTKALELEDLYSEKAKANLKTSTGGKMPQPCQKSDKPAIDTKKELAKIAGVSHDTIAKVKYINAHADADTKAKLKKKDKAISVNKVYATLKRDEMKKEHAKKVEKAKANPQKQSFNGPFDLILADPPWQLENNVESRAFENHYETATVEEIIKHKPNSSDNSVLFLWATAPKLLEALAVMKAWGFEYRTHAIWDKEIIGCGYWFRGQHELLLVGAKGKPGCPPHSERISSVLKERRTEHSKKPECVYQWIEKAFPDKTKLEMYCRSARNSWSAWGNEV
jgi:N6-adenosine-specific RNA methylase IME4